MKNGEARSLEFILVNRFLCICLSQQKRVKKFCVLQHIRTYVGKNSQRTAAPLLVKLRQNYASEYAKIRTQKPERCYCIVWKVQILVIGIAVYSLITQNFILFSNLIKPFLLNQISHKKNLNLFIAVRVVCTVRTTMFQIHANK